MSDPEELARENFDALLDRCGWVVQDKRSANLSASRGVALRELSFKTGEPDYTPLPFSYESAGTSKFLAEQQRIVGEVERRLSVVEELESVVNANLQRATRLRQSILQRAFSWKMSPLPNNSEMVSQ